MRPRARAAWVLFASWGALALCGFAEPTAAQQWWPQIATEGVKNFVPNSSFECGTANWGSWSHDPNFWFGDLFQLVGEDDATVARHGGHSLKIALTPKTLPVQYTDYFYASARPMRRVLAANRGWFHVRPGEALTLSAWLRADQDDVAGELAVNEAPEQVQLKSVRVSREWQRCEFTFTPTKEYLFIAVGLDLVASNRTAATLWLDAVQLERGDHATVYEPRTPLESFVTTAAPGNVFTDPAAGIACTVHAYNDTDDERLAGGRLEVTDFFDRVVQTVAPDFKVPARHGAQADLAVLRAGANGFFRATWTTPLAVQTLRCAAITPTGRDAVDSPFGFNNPFPWDFMVELAREAGVVWWRDWSAKWQTVESERGKFDFTAADEQIQRVLKYRGQMDILLPFPSAAWASTARMDEIENFVGPQPERSPEWKNYLRTRSVLAFPPTNDADFGRYVLAVAQHYRQNRTPGLKYFQILNESVYTSYSLPRRFGYSLADYLRLLETGSAAVRGAGPECRVIGGIGANLTADLTREFVNAGGLKFVDIFDLHMYDPPRPAEVYAEPFQALEKAMRTQGGLKPIWITEWGCYADDDPPVQPLVPADQAVGKCWWPSERAATEHMVKFAAVAMGYGVRKIFFHASTSGAINGFDAGNVLFEYGGAPRKIYAGIAAFTRVVGVPDECVRRVETAGLYAYVFRTGGRFVAVVWSPGKETRQVKLDSSVEVYDIMGNRVSGRDALIGATPIYLVGQNVPAVIGAYQP